MDGSASGAHALLKVFEKDGGASYENAEAQMQKVQGSTIQERMTSRINTWGVGKWDCLSTHKQQRLDDAFALLRQACADKEDDIPSFYL